MSDFRNYKYSFAESLTRIMKAKKMSVRQLSSLSGVSIRTINSLRSGSVDDPKFSSIIAVCDVVNLSIDEMLDRDCAGIDETLMMNYHLLSDRDKKIANAILSDVNKEE